MAFLSQWRAERDLQRKAAGYYKASKGELPPQLQHGDEVDATTA